MTTNKIYQTAETAVVFKNTGGDVTMTLKNTADGHGRVSNQWDRGAGALPMRLKIEACMKAAASVTINYVWRVYIYGAQTAAAACDLTSDADLTVETQLKNFQLIGQVIASSNAAGPFYASFVVEVYGRYINLGVWNATGQAIANTDGTSSITVTPFPDDIQAAA